MRGKRNAVIGNSIIENSGVADYILIGSEINSAQEALDNIIPIKDYVNNRPQVFFACKALNLRTKDDDKHDGDRPLAVYVNWQIDKGKLQGDLIFDNPLAVKGNTQAEYLRNCLDQLNIKTTDDICSTNANPNQVFPKNS